MINMALQCHTQYKRNTEEEAEDEGKSTKKTFPPKKKLSRDEYVVAIKKFIQTFKTCKSLQ